MTSFLWTLITLWVLMIFGKALMIADGSYSEPRNPKVMCFEILTTCCFVGWAAYLLGAGK